MVTVLVLILLWAIVVHTKKVIWAGFVIGCALIPLYPALLVIWWVVAWLMIAGVMGSGEVV